MRPSVRGIANVLTLATLATTAACGGKGAEARPAADSAKLAAVKPSGAASEDPRVQAADQSRIKGNPDAKVWVVIASDFECPYCRQWDINTAPALDSEYVATGKVRVAYVHYPLSRHPHAMPAAEASMCAAAQGKFWEMHHKIFQTADEWLPLADASKVFARLATEVGVDAAAYDKCMADDVMIPMIEADRERARAAGVKATPSFMIGSTVLEGGQPIEQFRPVIDAALAAAK